MIHRLNIVHSLSRHSCLSSPSSMCSNEMIVMSLYDGLARANDGVTSKTLYFTSAICGCVRVVCIYIYIWIVY